MAKRIVVEERDSRVYVTRFDAHQRAQHLLMIFSFFVLAATGLPLKYSDWASSAWWIGVWHGVDNVRAVHRYAAWVMIATCVYHLLYVLVSRPFPKSMLPRRSDFTDFLQDMKHTFRLSKQPPQFDRFSYRNKAAYWLVYPGALVMIGTGIVLLYPTEITRQLPGWVLPLSLMIHSDAAVLATGWVLCVHMYFAHFSRHTFPLDRSVLTGKVPIKRYREEFPREFARIIASEQVPVPTTKPKPSDEEGQSYSTDRQDLGRVPSDREDFDS